MAKMGRPSIPRVTLTCERCGKQFERRWTEVENSTGRFFCSQRCRKIVGSKPRRGTEAPCPVCGTTVYSTPAVPRKYCSKTCFDQAQVKTTQRDCEVCGKSMNVVPSYPRRFCSRACYAEGLIQRPLDRQHNGRPAVLDSNGYVRVFEPAHPHTTKTGWVFEHRILIEKQLGRILDAEEHVHHINGIKDDNRLENLVVLGHGDHSKLHQKQNRETRVEKTNQLAGLGEVLDERESDYCAEHHDGTGDWRNCPEPFRSDHDRTRELLGEAE